MKAETWQALNSYKAKFGSDWPEDLNGIKNSEESGLVERIKEAMKKPVRKPRKTTEGED